MELEFQRIRLERYEPSVDTILSQEVTAESIVPDAFPDVSRVVCTFGEAYITTKQAMPHSVKVMGTLHLHVLYIPEGESTPRSLALELPFQCSGDFPQIGEHDALHVSVVSVCAETRLLNPRKLLAKAEVKLHALCYAPKDYDVVCDLAKDEPSIQSRKAEHKCNSILAALEKPFSFSDTLRQSPAKPAIEEILAYRMHPTGMDARYIGNKLICKGIMVLDGLYRSGAELLPMQFELPFSQILEFEGTFEDGEPDIILALKHVDCTLRDGELDVVVDALIQATIWSGQTVTMLSDLYSTAEPLDVERTHIPVCTYAERGSNRETVRKFCESGIPAKQVLKASVCLNPLGSKKTDTGMQYSADALVDILYVSEDDALCGVNYTLPVACDIEVPKDCACTCNPVGEVVAVPVTGGMEVRMEVDFDWIRTKTESNPCVYSVKKGTAENSKAPQPSVMIRMVAGGETLWDIAKACRSTVRDICMANDLSSESAERGSMLLIPTKRD